MASASNDPSMRQAVDQVRVIFDRAVLALRAAGLEHEARKLERCGDPDPSTPHSCAYGTLVQVETSVLLEWGRLMMGRGTPVARALRMLSLAKTAFFVVATGPVPFPFLTALLKQAGEDARVVAAAREDTAHDG